MKHLYYKGRPITAADFKALLEETPVPHTPFENPDPIQTNNQWFLAGSIIKHHLRWAKEEALDANSLRTYYELQGTLVPLPEWKRRFYQRY